MLDLTEGSSEASNVAVWTSRLGAEEGRERSSDCRAERLVGVMSQM